MLFPAPPVTLLRRNGTASLRHSVVAVLRRVGAGILRPSTNLNSVLRL